MGLALIALGYAAVSTLQLSTSTTGYVARIVWIGLGMGTFQSPNNSAILGAVPRSRLGVASGLVSLSRTFGQTTGIALLGAAWAALVHWLSPSLVGDATHASRATQLEAFCWVARGCTSLILAALALVLWKGRPKKD